MKAFTTGPFTGRDFAAILVVFFTVVLAVNVLMARDAIATFGGVVVENSYVASQEFNGWLRESASEKALGWSAHVSRRSDGRVAVRLAGAPASAALAGDVWHPLGRLPDLTLGFSRSDDGSFVSRQALPPGRWRLRLEVKAGTQRWRDEQEIL